ncbi:Endogenous Retrovirus Group S71 Member 1 Env Polyprotein [Manis pentadactyla]|nr:Endogenous Retrovirus Group S71 Member 1 Env Polyprotein [Manis pentadactyla]
MDLARGLKTLKNFAFYSIIGIQKSPGICAGHSTIKAAEVLGIFSLVLPMTFVATMAKLVITFICLQRTRQPEHSINHGYRTVPPNLARSHGFYACPETGKGKSCGWERDFWCAKWDCVTLNDGDWRWPVTKKDAVKFSYVNQGIPRHVTMALYKDKACDRRDQDWVRVQFTETGKKTEASRWINRLTWGLAYYKYGGHEGSTLTIKLAVSTPSSIFIGPNPVVHLQQPVIHPQKPSNQNKDLGQRDEKMSTGRMPVPHARLSSPRGALAGTNGHIHQPTTGTHAI